MTTMGQSIATLGGHGEYPRGVKKAGKMLDEFINQLDAQDYAEGNGAKTPVTDLKRGAEMFRDALISSARKQGKK